MPVCPSCFAYYVRAPCPFCADTGHPKPATSEAWSVKTTGVRVTGEKALKREIQVFQGKVDTLQKENQKLKEELTEKNRIITRLEADLRSSQDDQNFLLTRIEKLEGKEKAAIAPEQEPEMETSE